MIETRSLKSGLNAIATISSMLDLSDELKTSAKNIYKRLSDGGVIQGRHVKEMAIVSVKIALRDTGIPVIFNDFLPFISRDKEYRVSRYYAIALKKLGLKSKPLSPSDLVDRVCDDLELSERVKIKTSSLLKSMKNTNIFLGKNPIGVFAGALYFSAFHLQEHRTQEDIATLLGITSVTIRKRLKNIKEMMS